MATTTALRPSLHPQTHSHSSLPLQRPRRYSAMPSAFLDKFHEIETNRNVKARESASSSTPRKVSFMGSSKDSKSPLQAMNAIKSRLVRKRPSAPALSKDYTKPAVVASPLASPTTPTGSTSQDGQSHAQSLPSRSEVDSPRKQSRPSSSRSPSSTSQAGRQLRHSASVEGKALVDSDARGYEKLDLKLRGHIVLHPYQKDEAPYMQSYNATPLLK